MRTIQLVAFLILAAFHNTRVDDDVLLIVNDSV